jgi:hypothetical protein
MKMQFYYLKKKLKNMAKRNSTIVMENVYSPIDDPKMGKHIKTSTVWDLCFKEEEVTNELTNKHPQMFIYSVKFDGLTPIQVTKIKKIV